MSWLFYAIVARFFWACANLIDQYITRFSGHKSMLAVMINCNVIMLPILIAAVCVFGVPVHMKPVSVMWLGAGVVANMATLYPYYLALHEDEAHNTMPLFEMIPVFVTFLAYTGQVVALSGIQPFFVLLISAILGFVLPRYYRRLVWDRELKIKFLLLFVIAAGIVLLQG